MSGWAIPEREQGAGKWVFLCLLALYLLTYSGAFHSIDEVSIVALTESLVKHGRVTTDQITWSQEWLPSQGFYGPDGHVYSKKGVGTALLAAPFYWLALHLPGVGLTRALMVVNALVTALTAWLLYDCVRFLGYRSRVATLVALGFGAGTMAWPYARYLFSEPLQAAGLVLGLWGLLAAGRTGRARFAAVAGAGLGVALLAKVTNGGTWPLFAAYAGWLMLGRGAPFASRRRVVFALAFLLPLLLAGLGLMAYNHVRTGDWLGLGYWPDTDVATPFWRALFGLLLSPGKGLFVFSPLLLAAPLGVRALLCKDRLAALLGGALALYFPLLHALIARRYMWWGGWGWGPRYLLPAVPFLCLFLAPVLDWALRPGRRWARWSLAGLGLVTLGVQTLGVGVDFNRYLLRLYGRSIEGEVALFRIGLSPLLGHWPLLRAGQWDVAWAADPAGRIVWPLLVVPLALLAAALLAWRWGSRIGRTGHLLARVGLAGLILASLWLAARQGALANDWQQGSGALSAALGTEARPGDALIVDLRPYAAHMQRAIELMDRYRARPAYWGWARQEPLSEGRAVLLAALGQQYRTLWLALESTPEADPASTTERWLDEHAYRVGSRWLGPAVRLVRYHLAESPLDTEPAARLDARLGECLWLRGVSPSRDLHACPGDVLALSLFWQAEGAVGEEYVVFLQLLDGAGSLRAQADRPPVGGFRPTSSWHSGDVIRDNYGLALPPDLPPGRYRLIAGMYLPATMARLTVRTAGRVEAGNFVELAAVTIPGGGCR